MARRQRELEEEEAERKRRDAAAAKLRALDEAIAAREAERWAELPCSICLQSGLNIPCAGLRSLISPPLQASIGESGSKGSC